MQILVNDAPREIADDATITDLLSVLDLPSSRVAVEVNRELVRRAEHPTHHLQAGDRVEVVTFVGGG